MGALRELPNSIEIESNTRIARLVRPQSSEYPSLKRLHQGTGQCLPFLGYGVDAERVTSSIHENSKGDQPIISGAIIALLPTTI